MASTRRQFLIGAAVLSAAACVPTMSTEQEITGVVSDNAGTPLAGARVTTLDGDGRLIAEARTDATGRYAIQTGGARSVHIGASAPRFAYHEVNVQPAVDFHLGPESHPGRWTTIGDTSPEAFTATNSGVTLPDGRLIYCHDTVDPVIFDPASGATSRASGSGLPQGCHGVSVLLDGRVIYLGGQDGPHSGDFGKAISWVKVYDPTKDRWERWPDLLSPRWYPTITRLPDGRLLVSGGGLPPDATRTATAEIYDPFTRTTVWTGSMLDATEFGPSVLLHNGDVLRTWFPPQRYSLATGQWRATGDFVQPSRRPVDHAPHSLVLLSNGRAVAIGKDRAQYEQPGMVEIYDPATETWSLGATPATLRAHPKVLQLPDGRILTAGGHKEFPAQPGETNPWGYVALADRYDPQTDQWQALAPMPIAREFHAMMTLAPDGRVIVTAGSGMPAGDVVLSNQIDAYEPPYLFRGPQPVIEDIDRTDVVGGDVFRLRFSGTAAPTSVVLVGLNAVTHYVDGGPNRRVDLQFEQRDDELLVRIPADARVVPAAHYWLFLLVDDIPSTAQAVRITHKSA